jgi:hypothetical protein
MDEWPYWMLEENINIVNEIIDEEENNKKKQEEQQKSSMPNMDTGSMMKNMTNSMPKF